MASRRCLLYDYQVCFWLFGTLPPADKPVEALVTVEKETLSLPRAVAELEINLLCVGRLRKAGFNHTRAVRSRQPLIFTPLKPGIFAGGRQISPAFLNRLDNGFCFNVYTIKVNVYN